MKHLKDYFDNFEPSKLESLFDKLYHDGWKISAGDLVDSIGTYWNYRDINHFVGFSKQVFDVIVASYKMFLEFQDTIDEPITKDSEKIQEKLDSANSKIRLLEEQNNNLKKELDIRRKELYHPVESPKPSTKEYISLKRRKYVKIE